MSHPSYEFIHYDKPLTKSDSIHGILSFYLVSNTFLFFMLKLLLVIVTRLPQALLVYTLTLWFLQLYINKVTTTHS